MFSDTHGLRPHSWAAGQDSSPGILFSRASAFKGQQSSMLKGGG